MNQDRWEDLIGQLEDDGKIESRHLEELEGRPGTVERVVAKTPLGRIRLSYTSEPKKLMERALYSKRGGSTMNIKATYDEHETVHAFLVERDEHGGWTPIDASAFANFS